MKFIKGQLTGFLFFSLIILVYSNSFHASWHLDDYHTIVFNKKIQMSRLSPESVMDSLHSAYGDGTRIYRPIPCLTFALNWLFGKDNVTGYHLVNILIHIFSAISLFFLMMIFYDTPGLKGVEFKKKQFTAALAVTLWAVNPLHTQAVTYIVQRMAILSALFYILSLLFYVKARLELFRIQKYLWFLMSAIMFIAALLSKENAVTLPAAVLLVEWVFFSNNKMTCFIKENRWVVGIGFAVMLLVAAFFLEGGIKSILNRYDDRTFTMGQRLLTEPRVLFFYLTQFFYPVPTRLSIEHDIELSTSLISPITTLPAVLFVLAMIVCGLLTAKKKPFIGFAILFFLLNHSVESSLIGLEIIFEHRNYLPTAFLFLPIAAFLNDLIERYQVKQKQIGYLLMTMIVAIIICFGIGTFTRNRVWINEKTLWEDAALKAPGRGRPYHNLAWGYYEVIGEYEKTLKLYEISLNKKWSSTTSKAFSYYGMGSIYYKLGNYSTAAALYDRAIAINNNDEAAYRQSVKSWIRLGKMSKASERLDVLLKYYPEKPEYLFYKGLILLHENQAKSALNYFRKVYAIDPANADTDYMVGISLYKLGELKRAEKFLSNTLTRRPDDVVTLLFLAKISKERGEVEKMDRYLENLLYNQKTDEIMKTIKRLKNDNLTPPVSVDAILPDIERKLKDIEKSIIRRF